MRNEKIDLLRFIGLSMIILAHVGPQKLIFQLRNFDVPLMVLLSGVSFSLSFKSEPYIQYVWKRVKRLLFPTWIFLTIYFVFVKFIPSIANIDVNNFRTLFNAYSLIGEIGYIWIIRVFLMIALVAPFIYRWSNKIKSDQYYLVILFLILLLYEFVKFIASIYFKGDIAQIVDSYISPYLFYVIPYSIIFALGLRINSMRRKNNYIVLAFSLITFCCFLLFFVIKEQTFIPTQLYKFPPSIYYFSYAVFISMSLWISSHNIWQYISKYLSLKRFILFVACNTMWIYLWHIPIVEALQAPILKGFTINFWIKYFIVYAIAVTITLIQVWFVNCFILPKLKNVNAQKNTRTIFTG